MFIKVLASSVRTLFSTSFNPHFIFRCALPHANQKIENGWLAPHTPHSASTHHKDRLDSSHWGRATVQKQTRMIAFYLLHIQRQKLSGAFGCYAEIMREHSCAEQVNQCPICVSSQNYRKLRLEMWRLMHISCPSLLRQTCIHFMFDCGCLLAMLS